MKADEKVGDGQFLYINSAFAPAPDDTVSNLYKVGNSASFLLSGWPMTDNHLVWLIAEFSDGRPVDSQLQVSTSSHSAQAGPRSLTCLFCSTTPAWG